MTVTVQSSERLITRTFRFLPLKGTVIGAVDAGRLAALHMNLKVPFSPLSPEFQHQILMKEKELILQTDWAISHQFNFDLN